MLVPRKQRQPDKGAKKANTSEHRPMPQGSMFVILNDASTSEAVREESHHPSTSAQPQMAWRKVQEVKATQAHVD